VRASGRLCAVDWECMVANRVLSEGVNLDAVMGRLSGDRRSGGCPAEGMASATLNTEKGGKILLMAEVLPEGLWEWTAWKAIRPGEFRDAASRRMRRGRAGGFGNGRGSIGQSVRLMGPMSRVIDQKRAIPN
jgi:hypothetical protein